MSDRVMKSILSLLKDDAILIDTALMSLVDIGYCPLLLNDDTGRWALVFDGVQTIPDLNKPINIQGSYYVETHQWKDTIKEAMIQALRNEVLKL